MKTTTQKNNDEERVHVWRVELNPQIAVVQETFLHKQSLRKLGLVDTIRGKAAVFQTREKARAAARLISQLIKLYSDPAVNGIVLLGTPDPITQEDIDDIRREFENVSYNCEKNTRENAPKRPAKKKRNETIRQATKTPKKGNRTPASRSANKTAKTSKKTDKKTAKKGKKSK